MLEEVIKKTWHPVDLGAWPRQSKSSRPPLSLKCTLYPLFSQPRLFQGCNPEKLTCCWNHLDRMNTWLNPVKAFKTFKILAGGYRGIVVIQITSHVSFLVVKPATYQSRVAFVFLQSLLDFCVEVLTGEPIAITDKG